MATLTQDILPYRLKRKRWESPRRYTLTISQDKAVGSDEMSLRFSIPLTLTMVNLYEKSAIFRLQLRRPSFDGSQDYDKLQWVFAKLMSVSRDIHIRTKRSGSIWEILNEQQIRDQWPDVKQQILEMYEDPLVEDLVRRHEQNLTHYFESMYTREPLLQLLFNDLFRNYSEKVPAETKKELPRHLGDIPFPIIERKQLIRLDSLQDKAVITTEGRPDMDRVDQEAVNSYLGTVIGNQSTQPYDFSHEGHYQMDTALGCIREASLTVGGSLGDAYSKSTNYHLMCTDDA